MKLVIFDMDGTLINSGDAIANTINHVRTQIGLTPLTNEYILSHINDPTIRSSEFFYGTSEFTPEQTELFNDYYHQHCLHDTKLYDGIKQLIENLSQYCHLAVATNASSVFAKRILAHLNIIDYFDPIIGHDNVSKSKPDPEMIKIILQHLNINPSDAVIIGDSKKDSLAAKQAGIDSILVNWGFSDHKTEGLNCVQELYEQLIPTVLL